MQDNQNLNEGKKKERQSLFLHSSFSCKSNSEIHAELDSRNGALTKSVPPIPVVQKSWHSKSLKQSTLDCKEVQPVHSEGDQPWDFFGRNDAKAEAPVPWPPHAKSWLIGKDFDAGRD